MQPAPLQLTHCPACDAPAEIAQRTVLESTAGPIAHVKIHCVRRHWFFVPQEVLDGAPRTPVRHGLAAIAADAPIRRAIGDNGR